MEYDNSAEFLRNVHIGDYIIVDYKSRRIFGLREKVKTNKGYVISLNISNFTLDDENPFESSCALGEKCIFISTLVNWKVLSDPRKSSELEVRIRD